MNPYLHAKSSAAKFGGVPEDYYDIHEFIDSSKSAYAKATHRAILHNSFASSVIIPRIFGVTITNSLGKQISTKDIAEQHILEDTGRIPSVQDWCSRIRVESWMGPPGKGKKKIRGKSQENHLLGLAPRPIDPNLEE